MRCFYPTFFSSFHQHQQIRRGGRSQVAASLLPLEGGKSVGSQALFQNKKYTSFLTYISITSRSQHWVRGGKTTLLDVDDRTGPSVGHTSVPVASPESTSAAETPHCLTSSPVHSQKIPYWKTGASIIMERKIDSMVRRQYAMVQGHSQQCLH